ncbi:VWA domain-containing protein [Salinispirillum sp. LH 10-3-1]|uniref:VWA domain-containing protein n=1 Tax=Salinispirillum sp. LH 10-3-1 TaxID=2952525 RepID=A0AB38YKA6_9GAMM
MQALSDLTFAWPWLILLLPAAWAVRRFLGGARNDAIRLPHAILWRRAVRRAPASTLGVRTFLLTVAWVLLVLALMRPTVPGDSTQQPLSGRQVMLVVDLSQSMSIADMILNGRRANRLDALKVVLHEFIASRTGDQLGLAVFGTQAYLVLPVTPDLNIVAAMVDDMRIGMAGNRTALGEGLAIGIAHLVDNQPQDGERVLVLLSDGAQNEGNITPLEAAAWAADYGVRIHSIGFGLGPSRDGNLLNPSGLSAADLDEPTLIAVAEQTGGRYFRAESTAQLQDIYRTIDRLEPTIAGDETLSPRRELFHLPAAFSLLLLALVAALSTLQTQVLSGRRASS